jgi:hypothetical protein
MSTIGSLILPSHVDIGPKNPLMLQKHIFTFVTFMGMFSFYTHHQFAFTMTAHMTIYQLLSRHRVFLVFLGPRANAGMVPVIFFSKLPLHASHVALH